MSEEEKKAISQFKEINLEDCSCEKCLYQEIEDCRGCPTMIKETLLNLIEKQQKEIENIKQYAEWHISHLTEDIKDYIDDDKKKNADIIGELKEDREHWRDIIRITKNEKTYIDYNEN